MARRQSAAQYHDLKAVNKFSEAWKISNMMATLCLTDTACKKKVREDRIRGLFLTFSPESLAFHSSV